MTKWTRRALTKAALLGLGMGAGLPVLSRLAPRRVHAAAGGPLQRLLIFYMPNCSLHANWALSGGYSADDGSGDPADFEFNAGNAPFEAVREHLTVVQGLDSFYLRGDEHTASQVGFMTGDDVTDPNQGPMTNLAIRPSIDQILQHDIASLKGPRIDSLQICGHTQSDRNDFHHRIVSFDLNANPMPPENKPFALYQRVFGEIDGSLAELEAMIARDKRIVGAIQAELDELAPRLPDRERQRLIGHEDGLEEVVAGLDHLLERDPALDAKAPQWMNLRENHNEDYVATLDAFWELTRASFELDITRVATFMFASANSYASLGGHTDGILDGGGLHALAHASEDANNTNARTTLLNSTRWYCQFVADKVAQLAELRELDGSSMLDHTLVVFFSEVSEWHDQSRIPLVLFGGHDLGLPTGGRLLNYSGRYSNDFWLTVARAYGHSMTQFGAAGYGTSGLDELFG